MVLGVGVTHAADGPSPGGATGAQRDLEELLTRLNSLDAWIDEAGERIANGQREVAAADRRVAAAAARIRELDNRIERGRGELEGLGIERERLEQTRRRQAGRVADHLRDAWRFKERDPLQALLNLEEPRTLEKMVRYHAAFAKARTAQVDELRQTLEELERNQREQDRERVSLENSRKSANADRARLISERSRRQSHISNLNAELAKRTEERDRLNRDRNRLESLIAELARARRPAPGRTRGGGPGGRLGLARAGAACSTVRRTPRRGTTALAGRDVRGAGGERSSGGRSRGRRLFGLAAWLRDVGDRRPRRRLDVALTVRSTPSTSTAGIRSRWMK